MAVTITGTPNLVNLYPTAVVTFPAGYSASGGSSAAVLGDSIDTTYLQEGSPSDYFRAKVGTTQLPNGARVVYAQGVARATRTGTSPRNYLVFMCDSSGPKGTRVDLLPSTTTTLPLNTYGQYRSPAHSSTRYGGPITQADLNTGLYVAFGKSLTGATDATAVRTSAAWVELSYDKPPTAAITAPTGTLTDSGAALVTWDYTDDLQPQDSYRVAVTSVATQKVVYDSGVKKSGDTFHQLTKTLPNGSYSVSVWVYQRWTGGGGAFRSLAPATGSFTVSTLQLPTPSLTPVIDPDGINLLTGNSASFASGLGGWSATSGTLTYDSANQRAKLVLDGTGAGSVTCLVPYSSLPVSTRTPLIFGINGLVETNPVGSRTRVNLCTNPSFEVDISGWTATGASGPTLAQGTAEFYSGTKSLKITATGANTFFAGAMSPSFATSPGLTYTVSARMKLPTAGGISSVSCIAAGLGVFGNTVTAKDSWQVVSVTFTATSTSHTVDFTIGDSATVAGQYCYLDACLVEQIDSVQPYFDGSTGGGAVWTGTANASTSTIAATARNTVVATPSYTYTDQAGYGSVGTSTTLTTVASNAVLVPSGMGPDGTAGASVRLTVAFSAGDFGGVVYLDSAILNVYDPTAAAAKALYQNSVPAPHMVDVLYNNHFNLMSYDDSTFDNGLVGWPTATGCTATAVTTPVASGAQAVQITTSATTASLAQIPGAILFGVKNADGTFATTQLFQNVTVAAQVSPPSTLTGRGLAFKVHFYDANLSELSTFTTAPSAFSTTGYQSIVSLPVAVTNSLTAYLSVDLIFTGSSGDVWNVDQVMVSDPVSPANYVWSRGGILTNTTNLLSYNDSTFNAGNNWVANNASTTVDSFTTARHGSTAMRLTRLTTAGTADAGIGNNVYVLSNPYNTTANTVFTFQGSIYSPVTSRTFQITYTTYDSSFAVIASASQSVASTVGAWKTLKFNINSSTFAANAYYVGVSVQVLLAAINEVHYVDTVGVQATLTTPVVVPDWQPGIQPSTDASPVVHLLDADSGVEIDTITLTDLFKTGTNIQVHQDYEVNGIRRYQTYLSKTENGVSYMSPTSAVVSVTLPLSQAWLHSRGNPPGTSHQFNYGSGLSNTIEVVSSVTPVEGREFGFAEFSDQSQGKAAISLQCPSDTTDRAALEVLANERAEVVFRDGLGRSVAGVMGEVSFDDQPWGCTASFTLTLTGIQP